MKARIYMFLVLFLLVVIYASGCRRAGLWLVKKDEISHADAMVLLMGSVSDRLLQTVDLYNQGAADLVLIAEEETNAFLELKKMGVKITSTRDQIREALILLGIPSGSIKILSGNAQSTKNEATIISQLFSSDPEIDTLILVTSPPHTRRAYYIFKRIFKKSKPDICILCSPSAYSDFNPEKWWRKKDDIETVLINYLKMVNFFINERWRD